MGDQIKADYEALEQIASQFAELGQKARDVRSKVLTAYEDVNGTWQGKGWKAFEDQMERDIKASLNNLEMTMNSTANSIRAVAKKFHDAEEAVRGKGSMIGGGIGRSSAP